VAYGNDFAGMSNDKLGHRILIAKNLRVSKQGSSSSELVGS